MRITGSIKWDDCVEPFDVDLSRPTKPPAFEVRDGSKVYRIWSDGRIDGFGTEAIVVNRIPAEIGRAVASARDTVRS